MTFTFFQYGYLNENRQPVTELDQYLAVLNPCQFFKEIPDRLLEFEIERVFGDRGDPGA
jgi:hypothetical protein